MFHRILEVWWNFRQIWLNYHPWRWNNWKISVEQPKHSIIFWFCDFAKFCICSMFRERISSYFEASFVCLKSNLTPKINSHFLTSSLFLLQSFADKSCSGKVSCHFHVNQLMHRKTQPCPLELSSYFEASFMCIPSNQIKLIGKYKQGFNLIFLQSFADPLCSAKSVCQFRVNDLMHSYYQPCPLELSSYLEASYICIPSKYTWD